MRINTQEDIGILLMTELAKHPKEHISLEVLAKNHGLSNLYLKKIASKLKKSQLIISKEGLNGGYRLAIPLTEINLWQILLAFSSEKKTLDSRLSICPLNTNCLPQKVRQTLTNALEKSFSKIKLEELIN